jgi:hypothetical protein
MCDMCCKRLALMRFVLFSPDHVAKRGLTHFEHELAHSYPTADMLVGRTKDLLVHYTMIPLGRPQPVVHHPRKARSTRAPGRPGHVRQDAARSSADAAF